jgi:hypothetical protein
MAAVAAIGGLAVGAYSAYNQSQASSKANATASAQASATEQNQEKQDQTLQTQEAQNNASQVQDAQWMQMKSMANAMQGLSTQAPAGLTGPGQAGVGAGAMGKAGKL